MLPCPKKAGWAEGVARMGKNLGLTWIIHEKSELNPETSGVYQCLPAKHGG